MNNFKIENFDKVLEIFKEICAIPHGSGNMEQISQYIMEKAKCYNLKAVRDDAKNVVIYKKGTKGYENSAPIILQGHLDMVCQKTEERVIDFEKDALDIYVDGDFLKARGTTLGADNGIAVAMMLAILSADDIEHPPIEAVFTTDEEIGMIGAGKLDKKLLSGKQMINLDAEEGEMLTVSCAGGSEFEMEIPVQKALASGTKIALEIKGLKGGHSGVEIDKKRENANMLAGRFLNDVSKETDFEIISINGGNKGNAIPLWCKFEIVAKNTDKFLSFAEKYCKIIKEEIIEHEEGFEIGTEIRGSGEFEVLDSRSREKLIYMLLLSPNGIVNMSAEIDGLVETSLNLGILMTKNDNVTMLYTLRSNKKTARLALESKLKKFAEYNGCTYEISGVYEPWEFKKNSPLQKIYTETYKEQFGKSPEAVAIHAGLECAVFASEIKGLDCIAIGPDVFDVHTVKEKLSISSAKKIFEVLCKVLEKIK